MMADDALQPGNATFDAYLREASAGRNSLPRLVLAIALIVVSYVIPIAMIVIVATGSGNLAFDDLLSGTGIALMLLSIAWLAPATALALRLVHRRRPTGILGVGGVVCWRQFRLAFALTAIVLVAVTLAGLLYDPRIDRGPASLATWATFAPIFGILILLQTGAEELFFRGYLVQTLASRFRNPFVWRGLPAVSFTVLHWNSDVSMPMNLAALASVAAFAVAATVLLVRTGNLGAAMGFHFANNTVALLFFSSSTSFNPIALFVLPPIESPEWSPFDAVLFAVVQIAAIVLVAILLVHERSPFRIADDGAKVEGFGDPEPMGNASDR